MTFVAGIGVDFLDTEGQERKRKELEAVLGFGAIGDWWEEGVLCAGFFVCW